MKKICIIFLLSIIISLTAFGFTESKTTANTPSSEYLRIHIRADSNDGEAQSVKYLVRDGVVAYLTPLVANYHTQLQAVEGVRARVTDIEKVASSILRANGFSYEARVQVRKERFPTRVYEGYTLPSGEYDALVIELGKGLGDNWWCVVYPPLCFATQGNIVYKSKIAEIIREWRKQ